MSVGTAHGEDAEPGICSMRCKAIAALLWESSCLCRLRWDLPPKDEETWVLLWGWGC